MASNKLYRRGEGKGNGGAAVGSKTTDTIWRDRKEWLVLIVSSTEWWRGILADGKEPASMI
jgi:hypothetical protein